MLTMCNKVLRDWKATEALGTVVFSWRSPNSLRTPNGGNPVFGRNCIFVGVQTQFSCGLENKLFGHATVFPWGRKPNSAVGKYWIFVGVKPYTCKKNSFGSDWIFVGCKLNSKSSITCGILLYEWKMYNEGQPAEDRPGPGLSPIPYSSHQSATLQFIPAWLSTPMEKKSNNPASSLKGQVRQLFGQRDRQKKGTGPVGSNEQREGAFRWSLFTLIICRSE